MPSPTTPTPLIHSSSPRYPRDPWERDAKTTARRRYVIVAIAATLATAIFLYAVGDAKLRAAQETAQAELARLQALSLETAWQIEEFFDERFAALDNFADDLLAVSRDAEAADRLAVALVEDDEAVLSAAFAVGDVFGTVERTDEDVVVSRDLFRARGEEAQWVQDAYEKPSDELDRYMGHMLSALMNPSPYGNPYATMAPPRPLMATEISISFDVEGLAWMELSLRGIEDICDKLRGAYYTAPLLLTHEGTPALPSEGNERATSEVRILLEVGPEQSAIMGDEYYARSIFAANDVRIGETGRTWRIAFHSDYDSVTYGIRDEYDMIRIIGLFVIFLIALAAAVVVHTREVAARPKITEPDVSGTDATADPAFMERTKNLRHQRLACRLICVLFFIPSLFFIAKRDKAFEAAMRAGNEEGMKAAVAGMWPAAIIGLLLGLAILWANLALR